MAAEFNQSDVPASVDSDRVDRILYLTNAAKAAREQGKYSVAEKNFRRALREAREYHTEIESSMSNVRNNPEKEEHLREIATKLERLESNIAQELKLL
jgi:hypothetical protein